MRKVCIIAVSILLACSFCGCKNYATNKLKREMKPFAKSYLKTERVVDYDSLTIDCVDTITEMGYARVMVELLNQMEASYQAQYDQAVLEDKGQKLEYLHLYLNEIDQTKTDFEDLMENGDLKENGILLYMVSGHYWKDNERVPLIFFVTADKRKIYTMDPFGDNLLYKDE